MAYNYNYQQVLDAAAGYGYTLSDADLRLASQYPDAGMSIVEAKRGYMSALNDAEREYYNNAANQLRAKYGNYSGGLDGSYYIAGAPTPSSYSYAAEAPSYQPTYTAPVYTPTYSAPVYTPTYSNYDRPSFSYSAPAPVYSSSAVAPSYDQSYMQDYRSAASAYKERDPFAYDYATDPVYQAYADQYRREGQRAAENTLGSIAGANSGRVSSYAASAAAQAANQYAAALSGKVPELEQQAYSRYLAEQDLKARDVEHAYRAAALYDSQYGTRLNQYNADRSFDQNMYLAALDQYNANRNFEYNSYLAALDQYNADRSFDYNSYLAQLDQYNTNRNFEYNQYLTELNRYNTDRNFEYNQYLTELDRYNADRNFGYNRHIDNIQWNQALEAQRYERAKDAAALGDYTGLAAYGVDTTALLASDTASAYAAALDRAKTAAQYGDYSGLNELGINTAPFETRQEQLHTASLAETYANIRQKQAAAAKALSSGSGTSAGAGIGSVSSLGADASALAKLSSGEKKALGSRASIMLNTGEYDDASIDEYAIATYGVTAAQYFANLYNSAEDKSSLPAYVVPYLTAKGALQPAGAGAVDSGAAQRQETLLRNMRYNMVSGGSNEYIAWVSDLKSYRSWPWIAENCREVVGSDGLITYYSNKQGGGQAGNAVAANIENKVNWNNIINTKKQDASGRWLWYVPGLSWVTGEQLEGLVADGKLVPKEIAGYTQWQTPDWTLAGSR